MRSGITEAELVPEASPYTTGKPTYSKMFWLFMASSLLGVAIEGIWYFFRHDHWETHVVSMWGPFCIIYGFGAVFFYTADYIMRGKNILLRFLVCALTGDIVEMICGSLLRFGLNMKAWDYSDYPLDFMGLICLRMTVIWGIVGVVFGYLIPLVDSGLGWLTGKFWDSLCLVLSVFMAVNLLFTGVCLYRWAERHKGHDAPNSFMHWIDREYPDDYMSHRFCEWHFRDQ